MKGIYDCSGYILFRRNCSLSPWGGHAFRDFATFLLTVATLLGRLLDLACSLPLGPFTMETSDGSLHDGDLPE